MSDTGIALATIAICFIGFLLIAPMFKDRTPG
jgi:hypothetical protein